MRRVYAIAAAVVMDSVRRKIVWVVVLFGSVMAVTIPSLPSYSLGIVQAVFREVALALSYAAALVVALTLAASRIPGEVERRTVYNVLSKRVARSEYVLGTWLGIVGVLGACIAAFTVVNQVIGQITYGDAMWRLWEGALGVWLETSVVAAFAVAVSTLVGPIVVVVASIAFVFIAHSRAALLGSAAPRIAWVLFPSLDPLDVINPVAHGNGISATYAGYMILVAVAYSAACVLLGSVTFRRRDL